MMPQNKIKENQENKENKIEFPKMLPMNKKNKIQIIFINKSLKIKNTIFLLLSCQNYKMTLLKMTYKLLKNQVKMIIFLKIFLNFKKK